MKRWLPLHTWRAQCAMRGLHGPQASIQKACNRRSDIWYAITRTHMQADYISDIAFAIIRFSGNEVSPAVCCGWAVERVRVCVSGLEVGDIWLCVLVALRDIGWSSLLDKDFPLKATSRVNTLIHQQATDVILKDDMSTPLHLILVWIIKVRHFSYLTSHVHLGCLRVVCSKRGFLSDFKNTKHELHFSAGLKWDLTAHIISVWCLMHWQSYGMCLNDY